MNNNRAESKFTIGTAVAVISSGGFGDRTINRAEVFKVHKDGKFFLKTPHGESPTMWTPGRFDGSRANKAGQSGFSSYREHAEVWSAEHDVELADQRMRREARAKREAVLADINKLDLRSPDDRELIGQLVALIASNREFVARLRAEDKSSPA